MVSMQNSLQYTCFLLVLFNLKITDSNTCGICGSIVENYSASVYVNAMFYKKSGVIIKWIKEKVTNIIIYVKINRILDNCSSIKIFCQYMWDTSNMRIYILVCKKVFWPDLE